jgi:hypothetical protein
MIGAEDKKQTSGSCSNLTLVVLHFHLLCLSLGYRCISVNSSLPSLLVRHLFTLHHPSFLAMPSIPRGVVVIMIALASATAIQAYVIPEPLRSVDYRRHDLNVRIIEETSTHTVQTSSAAGSASELNGRDSDFLSQLSILSNYVTQANVNSKNMRESHLFERRYSDPTLSPIF